jgi:hypothetical protein
MDVFKTNLDLLLKSVVSENIKPSSFKNYKLISIKLFNLGNKKPFSNDLEETDLIKGFSNCCFNYMSIIDYLQNEENEIKDNTKKNYINTFLNIITKINDITKYNKLSKKKLKITQDYLTDYWSKLRENINTVKNNNVINEEKFITNEEFDTAIKKCRKSFDNDITDTNLLQEYILLMLYRGKYIPPLRNTYATMKIITNEDPVEENQNYIIHDNNTSKNTILLQEDKVSKHYGSNVYKINKSSILNKYLNLLITNRFDNDKNDFLEITGRNKAGEPLSTNGLTYYLQKIFEKHLDKKISSSELRKIFISNLPTNLTNNKLEKISKQMRHSLQTQQFTYKKVKN